MISINKVYPYAVSRTVHVLETAMVFLNAADA